MAKLDGILIDASADNICVYRMNGQIILRSKGSLTRNRVLKSKAFEKTRKYAAVMGTAARLGSAVYRQLAPAIRNRSLYQAITGMAASLLYQGLMEEEVLNKLKATYATNRF